MYQLWDVSHVRGRPWVVSGGCTNNNNDDNNNNNNNNECIHVAVVGHHLMPV